ncbi:MAG: CDP-alcohol phosphatidyltransferase family protein [Candidatus Pacearchaeota archaeon]|nr:CDP-alcohol phosphatidyltransferase family protein [Candidatus Pacearchaeota archaeon]
MLEKEKFNNFSIKIGNLLKKFGISPNMWTFFALVFALVSAFFIINQKFFVASLFFFLSALADFFDGSVARATNKTTLFGAYFDTIIDRYVEAIILFSFLFLPLPSIFFESKVWIFLALFGGLMTTYAKAAAKEKDILEKELPTNVFGRAVRTFLLFFAIFFSSFSLVYTTYVILLLSLVSNFTALERISRILKKSKFRDARS